MPMYDYRCSKCEHQFEEFQKMKDRKKPLKRACPNCGEKKTLNFIIGTPAICDPIRVGTKRHDKGWHEVLAKVNKANRTNIQSKFS